VGQYKATRRPFHAAAADTVCFCQLNRICLNGLLLGCAERKKLLNESDAKRAILELGRNG